VELFHHGVPNELWSLIAALLVLLATWGAPKPQSGGPATAPSAESTCERPDRMAWPNTISRLLHDRLTCRKPLIMIERRLLDGQS
jgi:hypothetical protein